MNRDRYIRQIHRWFSAIFVLTVIGNPVAMAVIKTPSWMIYAPLPPLFVLLLTGLYLFAYPYVMRWRSGRSKPLGASAM